jgi:threonine synthase
MCVTFASHLECVDCGEHRPLSGPLQCDCGGRLLVRYDLNRARVELSRAAMAEAPADMWRYAPVLPLRDSRNMVSMGEGWTPLLRARRLGEQLGCPNLWIKDESANPAGTWQARAYSCAVSCALEDGHSEIAAEPGHEEGMACAAYAAAAGLKAHVSLQSEWPPAFLAGCRSYGVLPGIQAVRNPLRIEGMKTTAYEIAEQFDWVPPRWVVCPTADGALALRKGFEELAALDWVAPGGVTEVICAPAVSLRSAIDAGLDMARLEGVLPSLDTAGCLSALKGLDDTVVIVNTASGLLFTHAYGRRFPASIVTEADKLGGLITPR